MLTVVVLMLIMIVAASSGVMILIWYCDDDIDSEWWSWQWRRWRCEGVQMVGFCAKVVPCWCSGQWQWLVPGLLLVSHHHLFCHRICFHWKPPIFEGKSYKTKINKSIAKQWHWVVPGLLWSPKPFVLSQHLLQLEVAKSQISIFLVHTNLFLLVFLTGNSSI